MKYRRLLTVIDIILIIVTVVVILGNSATRSKESNKTSENITDKIIENVKPVKNAIDEDRFSKNDLHKFIRKSAHFIEYGVLGVEMMLLLLLLFPGDPFGYLIYGLFLGLSLAVCDETVQRFTERTSSTVDVILDFGGICLGTAIAYFAVAFVKLISRKARAAKLRKRTLLGR